MKTQLPLILILILAIGCSNPKRMVEWTSTTNSSPWKVNPSVDLIELEDSTSDIIIKSSNLQQIVDGFGGCFNEMGWEALNLLQQNEKNQIVKDLFDSISGCKFNICRMPIGANDYAVDWYSHNETADDFEMTHFSIERDKKRLIPYIKEALAYNPNLKIWASPWCPPAWMKTNNHYACNPDKVNDLANDKAGIEMKDQFIMDEKHLNAYALYFSKFLDAYKSEGIDIYAVHVQNEPNSCQNFPSCIWTPASLAKFIGTYLGPHLEKSNPSTEIWLGTIERPQIERIDTVLQNPLAQKYIKGIGFQWAGKGAIPIVNKKYPNFKLMQSETECGNGSNDWAAAEHTFELMKHYFENGANSYMYWNMVLNETGKSQWGWKQNSMISVNSANKSVKYNPEFYLMKHFSTFIKPGARKIAIEKGSDNCLAFKNIDSIIIVYYNAGDAKEINFNVDDQLFKVKIDEKSFNTFSLKI